MSRSVIVLELNELVPELVDRFIQQHKLPGFARLRRESIVAVTDAEEAPPFLEPWIQWTTVHTGLPYAEHRVFQLGEGSTVKAPRVWDVVSQAGLSTWICGSMNAGHVAGALRGRLLTDPWSSDVQCVPDKLFAPYLNVVATYVREHTRDRVPLTKSDYAKFCAFMVANGLSLKTVTHALVQLASEARGGGRWRRATVLDRLQWDLFRHQYREINPALSTFFINSTAHFQHFHWREMEPGAFKAQPSDEDLKNYGDAILYGYQKMDAIVSECIDMAGPQTSIVLCTALSQQPMVHYEETAGKRLYRPHDVSALTRFAGVKSPYTYEPVMSDEFHLHFESESAAAAAEASLLSLRLDADRAFMRSRRTGVSLLVSGFPNLAVDEDALVRRTGSNETRLFSELFYAIGATSGMHHPHGMLWIRQAGGKHHGIVDRKVSLREIAPTLLSLIGLQGHGEYACGPMPELKDALSADEAPAGRPAYAA